MRYIDVKQKETCKKVNRLIEQSNTDITTVKLLNSGHLQVLKNLAVIKRFPLLGGSLTENVTFATKHFVRYSRHVRYLGCPLLRGFTVLITLLLLIIKMMMILLLLVLLLLLLTATINKNNNNNNNKNNDNNNEKQLYIKKKKLKVVVYTIRLIIYLVKNMLFNSVFVGVNDTHRKKLVLY